MDQTFGKVCRVEGQSPSSFSAENEIPAPNMRGAESQFRSSFLVKGGIPLLDLSPRLRAIADRIPQNARLADIGTDHAYLPTYLLHYKRIPYAIASDLREGPLARGRAVAQQWNIPPESISFRCSDGLRGIKPSEVDVIVLAGMGGETIAACLDGVSWSRDPALRYFLQPMSTVPELRRWLSEHAFCIDTEQLVREGEKLYVILDVHPGSMPPLSPVECWAGRQTPDMQSPERTAYLDSIIARRTRALDGMRQAKTRVIQQELEALEHLLADLQSMRKEWLSWQQ